MSVAALLLGLLACGGLVAMVATARAARVRADRARQELSASLWKAIQDTKAPEPDRSEVWWRRKERTEVLVHTSDDSTIRGVVLEVRDDGVLLTAAAYLGTDEKPIELAGDVFIHRGRIAFTQVPPPKASA